MEVTIYRNDSIARNEPASTVRNPKTITSGLMTPEIPPTSTIGPSACIATTASKLIEISNNSPPTLFTIENFYASYKKGSQGID